MFCTDWNETKVILHELEQLFSRDDDIKDVVDIIKMQNEIETQCANRLKDAKEIIKVMTAQLSAKEVEFRAPSQAEHLEALRNVSNKENLSLQIETLRKNIDTKKKNIAKMGATSINLKEKADEFNINADMADSRTAYAISLYAKISNITWDYKTPQGRISGFIGNDSKKELNSFDFDTTSMSSYELATSLWNLIDQNSPVDY